MKLIGFFQGGKWWRHDGWERYGEDGRVMIKDKRLSAFSTKNIPVFLFMPQIKRLKWQVAVYALEPTVKSKLEIGQFS